MSFKPPPKSPRKSLNTSLNKSDSCLDMSIKEYWVILNFPESDPGKEFEILSGNDLECDSWETLERGVPVTMRCGNAKVQGDVVTVSDDQSYLEKNFKNICDDYLKEKKGNESSIVPGQNDDTFQLNDSTTISEESSNFYETGRDVTFLKDVGTQTEVIEPETGCSMAKLKKKYEELRKEHHKFKSMFSEVKKNMEDTMYKIDQIGGDNAGKFSSTPIKRKVLNTWSDNDVNSCNNTKPNEMVTLGTGGTKLSKWIYEQIPWHNYSAATRKLLGELFPRETLATHSMTGKPSPANIGSQKLTKMRLDATIINDIIETVSKNCGVGATLVRLAITTKCADENKLLKRRQQKGISLEEENATVPYKKIKSDKITQE